MTAGKGIIHTEEITTQTSMRILQLWLVLPPEKRWAEPFLQHLLLEDVPTIKRDKSEIRVYSGSSTGLTSPLQNHTPFTLVDFKMEKNIEVIQLLPASYNGMIYLIDGSVWIGENKVEQGQAGWFDMLGGSDESEIIFKTNEKQGARFVLYAGQPHHATIVHHGPFIGDSHDDITRLYQEFRQGKMPHLNSLPANKKVRHSKENKPVALT